MAVAGIVPVTSGGPAKGGESPEVNLATTAFFSRRATAVSSFPGGLILPGDVGLAFSFRSPGSRALFSRAAIFSRAGTRAPPEFGLSYASPSAVIDSPVPLNQSWTQPTRGRRPGLWKRIARAVRTGWKSALH